ncbi:MAG: hypothetical protein JO019_03100 [Candidatus Kaiserbacteria bacterium]|nr:hypothetical protein [Candidatus Kaiserbacteria bacterium]
MTAFQIKIIAVMTMVIDHVGLFFFPQYFFLRIIGRLAFPLFAWLIANGAYHTRDLPLYGMRLFALAVVSQVPFTLANVHIGEPLLYLNVVFTLCCGLLAIAVIQAKRGLVVASLATLACAALADFIHSDYGAAGVLAIVAFYVFFENVWLMTIAETTILGLIPIGVHALEGLYQQDLHVFYIDSTIEIIGILSLICVALYNGKKGPSDRYAFYYFYPLQYVAICIGQLIWG